MSTITIVALGSRGDVQPIVALGGALAARGHAVRVATHARFRDFVGGAGLEHFAMGDAFDSEQLWASTAGLRLAETRDPLLYALRLFHGVRPHLERHFSETCAAAAGADLLLGLQTVEMASATVARALSLPWVPLFLSPPDPRFYHSGLFRHLAPWLADVAARLLGHRASFARAADRVLGAARHAPLRMLSDADGEGSGQGLALVGTSDVVVPRPADWEPRVVTTGYWIDDARPCPLGDALERFLAAGAPPVCVGFGSMPDREPHAIAQTAIEASRRAGARLIVLGGWGEGREAARACAESGSDDVLWLRDAAHVALFPRVAAVVHHGGAGTTAAALRAGVPSLAVPHFGDQRFWGRRIERLGAGPAPLARGELTVDALSRRLVTMLGDDAMRCRARVLGETLRKERGTDHAADVLVRSFAGWKRLAGWRASAGAEDSGNVEPRSPPMVRK